MNREQMIDDLLNRNPNWKYETLKSWPLAQLKAVYQKEASKIIKQIRLNLGLFN